MLCPLVQDRRAATCLFVGCGEQAMHLLLPWLLHLIGLPTSFDVPTVTFFPHTALYIYDKTVVRIMLFIPNTFLSLKKKGRSIPNMNNNKKEVSCELSITQMVRFLVLQSAHQDSNPRHSTDALIFLYFSLSDDYIMCIFKKKKLREMCIFILSLFSAVWAATVLDSQSSLIYHINELALHLSFFIYFINNY